MRNFSRLVRSRRALQQGISLVEVLVGVAITALISTVVTSLMFTTMSSGRSLRQQTDEYESLRLPAAMMMQDARFATRASCDWDYLRLQYSSPTDYVQYKFASWDGTSEVPDPDHLHRWVVQGGVVQRDDVVGWNMVPPDWSGWDPGTELGCENTGTYRRAFMKLVKAPLPGQEVGTHLEVTAFLR